MTAILHYDATIVPLDTVTVKADVVGASESSGQLASNSSVQLATPANPPSPIVVPSVLYTALAHCKVSTGRVQLQYVLYEISSCP